VDVGTGSGAIAVSLAAELPQALVVALDLSLPALTIARQNEKQHAQSQIHFILSDLLEPFNIQFDLICANLPYIPTGELNTLIVSQWEPRLALDGGESGLDVVTCLLQQARTRLAPGGRLLLEIEASLGEKTLAAAQVVFPEAKLSIHQDLAQRDRIIEIRLG
jgi:release factor glutamine methyltransferase